MPVDAVSTAATAFQGSQPARNPKQAMDGEMFMNLLVTQLQNQDPSSPMDTNQMMAQTTQLAMMEKLNEMSSLTEENFFLQMRTSAAALIGREVTYTGPDGETAKGTATSVSYAQPVPQVTVDGKDVALDLISGIAAPTVPATE